VIVVEGLDRLEPGLGRLFVVIGVFDGLHRGHAYLLEALRREAHARAARPTVLTFDHHPDEVLTGQAPPLLLDPEERLRMLEESGVEVAIVQPFDEATRRTPYDAFVRAIAARVQLAGFLMTPESSFGFERGGTPAAVGALGRKLGYDVAIVPPLMVDGRPVRSTEIRAAIARGDLAAAANLLGRPHGLVGDLDGRTLRPSLPIALPPSGRYVVTIDGQATTCEVDANGSLTLPDGDVPSSRRVRATFEPVRISTAGRPARA
jgi:riboflavin kinase / FMN adenylyltransferase